MNSHAQQYMTKIDERIDAQTSQEKKVDDKKKEKQTEDKQKKDAGEVKSENKKYSEDGTYNFSYEEDTLKKKKRRQELSDTSFQNQIVLTNDSSFQTDLNKKKKKKKYDSSMDSVKIQREEFTVEDSSMRTPLITLQSIFMDSAKEFLRKKNYDSAVFVYNYIIENFSGTEESKMAVYWKAQAEFAISDYTSALNDINNFMFIDECEKSNCSDSKYLQAQIYFRQQRYADAAVGFSSLLNDTTFSNRKYCYFYRAYCNGENGQFIQAIQDYTKFLAMDNYKSVSSAEAFYFRGFYKAKMNDDRGAIQDYTSAIDMYNGAYQASKEKNMVYFQKLIDCYITRGLANTEIKKYDEAIANYDIVIKMKPEYALAFHLKGLAEIGKGETDSGCLDLSKAGELGSVDAYTDIKTYCK